MATYPKPRAATGGATKSAQARDQACAGDRAGALDSAGAVDGAALAAPSGTEKPTWKRSSEVKRAATNASAVRRSQARATRSGVLPWGRRQEREEQGGFVGEDGQKGCVGRHVGSLYAGSPMAPPILLG